MALKPMLIRLDPRMRKGLEQAAKQELSSISLVIRRAIAQYLRLLNIKWEDLELDEEEKD